MEECLTIQKKLQDKRVAVMNNSSEILGAFRHKTTLHQFFPSTDNTF